jgi:hypothetical protein
MSRAAELILSLHGWVALSVVFLVPALEASAFVGILFPCVPQLIGPPGTHQG